MVVQQHGNDDRQEQERQDGNVRRHDFRQPPQVDVPAGTTGVIHRDRKQRPQRDAEEEAVVQQVRMIEVGQIIAASPAQHAASGQSPMPTSHAIQANGRDNGPR